MRPKFDDFFFFEHLINKLRIVQDDIFVPYPPKELIQNELFGALCECV